MANDPRIEPLAEKLREDYAGEHGRHLAWQDFVGQARDLLAVHDAADPLRALLADEDRAVEQQITEALNRHEYELLREGVIALGRTPVPFDELSDRTKRLRANQLRGHVEFVLAALREVAGL